MNQVTLTLPLDNAEALMRGSDLLVGLAKDARMKEGEMPEVRMAVSGGSQVSTVSLSGLTTTEAPLPPRPKAPKSEPEFDTDGLPWDERIHASTKTTTQDGRWKKKRGVDQSMVEEVEAELKGSKGPFYWHHPESDSLGICGTEAELQETLRRDGHVVEIDKVTYDRILIEQAMDHDADAEVNGVPMDAATPPPPPPPPPPPATSDMTFAELIKGITENQVNPDTVLNAVQLAGLANVGELFNRPDLIPQVARELGIES